MVEDADHRRRNEVGGRDFLAGQLAGLDVLQIPRGLGDRGETHTVLEDRCPAGAGARPGILRLPGTLEAVAGGLRPLGCILGSHEVAAHACAVAHDLLAHFTARPLLAQCAAQSFERADTDVGL